MRLENQVVVVTGGANGIGRALCERFSRESARAIIVADIDRDGAEQVARQIGGQAARCNVSHESDIQSLVSQTLAQYGQIDLFVSNAGVTASGGVDVSDTEWQRQWDINLMAHVYAARAVLPGMLARGGGYLLHTSSAAGLLTEIGSAPYSVTKHAVVALAEWLSVQYQRRGIKVSCLCPAGVATDFLDLDDPVHKFLHLSSVTPQQVADCVVEGLAQESFLILPHEQVREFFQFKTVNYESWLRNFSRIHEKMERTREKEQLKRADSGTTPHEEALSVAIPDDHPVRVDVAYSPTPESTNCTTSLRAIRLQNGQLKYVDHDTSRRQADPNLIPIRVLLAGICETDLQLVKGYMGFEGVLGHEFVGIAESGPFAGQRVVGEINCSCHRCETCRAGRPSHCPHRSVLGILNHDGAFADRVWLPQENLHVVPDSISNEEAVFVEPLAAAFQIPAQIDLSQRPRTIVLGDGRLGILCAQVLASSGCPVTLIGKHAWKLEIAQLSGIETALVADAPTDRRADLVVDCTGSATGLPLACQLVRPRGTIVLKTTVAAPHGPNLAPLVIDEITLVGSRCGPFPEAIRALAEGRIDVRPLISARFPMKQAIAAFAAASDGKHLKVLLDIGSP